MEASRPTNQRVIVRPHVYAPKSKQAVNDNIEQDVARWTQSSAAGSDLGRSDQTSARAYGRTLQEARQVCREALGNGLQVCSPFPNVSSNLELNRKGELALRTQEEQEVQADGAVNSYVSSLLLSIDRPSASEDGLSSLQLAGNSGARHVASYGWLDALVTAEQTVAAPDSVFELASVLVAWALAKMRLAAAAVERGAAGEGPLKVSKDLKQPAAAICNWPSRFVACRHTSPCRQLLDCLTM